LTGARSDDCGAATVREVCGEVMGLLEWEAVAGARLAARALVVPREGVAVAGRWEVEGAEVGGLAVEVAMGLVVVVVVVVVVGLPPLVWCPPGWGWTSGRGLLEGSWALAVMVYTV